MPSSMPAWRSPNASGDRIAERGRAVSPLSAEAIRSQRFRDTSFGRRGYRRHEVDLLLARVASEVESRDELIVRLRAEIADLREHYRAYYSDLGVVEGGLTNAPDVVGHLVPPMGEPHQQARPWASNVELGRAYTASPHHRARP